MKYCPEVGYCTLPFEMTFGNVRKSNKLVQFEVMVVEGVVGVGGLIEVVVGVGGIIVDMRVVGL